MRENSKNRTSALKIGDGVQGYHNGMWSSERYAFNGFGENLYFVSDRAEKLTVTDNGLSRANGNALKGYGLEIEIESSINSQTVLAEIFDKVIFSHFPKSLFKMQNDGSLNGASSVEVITQVMTKEFVRNHYADFKGMWEYMRALNTMPGNSCGMHCNISTALFGKDLDTQKKNIMKLHNFINKDSEHYATACKVLNRNINYTSYCGKMRADYLDMCGSHGYSMNYSHINVGRIEIRLVGPQKSFGNFRNTMEVIFHLIAKTKELSEKDFDNPVKLWSGCNRYVYDRLESTAVYNSEILSEIRATLNNDVFI